MLRAGWALDRRDNLIHCYIVRDGAATGQSLCRRSACLPDAELAAKRSSVPGRSYCSFCVVRYQNIEKTAHKATTGGRERCGHCGGNMFVDRDRFGPYKYCLQCSRTVEPLTGPPIELRSGNGRQRNPRLRNNTAL